MQNDNITFMNSEQVYENMTQYGLMESFLGMTEHNLFLDFCTGKSLKLLTYDSIFKYIFHASGNYTRLEHFLSAVLGFQVEVVELFHTESRKLVESGSIYA